MLKFEKEQKNYEIGGLQIGGQPGERPTVLIGSIFFSGHRIVRDPIKGLFDRDKAKSLLEKEDDISAATGNPHVVDVVGETEEALINYLEFVAIHTQSPMLIDSPSQKARIQAVKHFAHTEVLPRLIYNSIAEDHTIEELECLKECHVKSAVLLTFSANAMKPKSKLTLLQNDLLPAAALAGVENIIVDTGVLDIPSVSWAALAIRTVKENTGYPAGCAPANAIYTWEKMKAKGTPVFQSAASSVFAMTQSQGANFIFYGSIQNAPWVYASVAATDALIAYGGRLTGSRPLTQEHPLYKIF